MLYRINKKIKCSVNNFNITNRNKALMVDRRHYHKVQNEKSLTGELKNRNYKIGKINYKVELKENTKNRKYSVVYKLGVA